MMGGQSSKTESPTNNQSLPLPIDPDVRYTAHIRSYESACRNDPDLRAVDASIHEKTNRVLNLISTNDGPVRPVSIDVLMEVTDCLVNVNREAINLIVQCLDDLYSNKDMSNLVQTYLETSLISLDFCTALENCLTKVNLSKMIIRRAVEMHEKEAENGLEGKCVKTCEELRRFKEAGNPFDEEFGLLFRSVYEQQVLMFSKIQAQKAKLDQKLKSLKTWRKVSNVIFITAFASILIFSVVAAAMTAPPVVGALVAALAVPVGPVGKWCNTVWSRYLKTYKEQRVLITSMEGKTYLVIGDFESISALVSKLVIQIDGFLGNADFALGEDDNIAVKIVIEEIKKKLEGFSETVDHLIDRNRKCSDIVTTSRTVIIQKIIEHRKK